MPRAILKHNAGSSSIKFDSAVSLWVFPTDGEQIIARHTRVLM